MPNHENKYSQLFDYLSADEPARTETGLVVFGRKDLLVAHKAIEIVQREATPWVVISGGFGKDSGDLNIPESHYLANEINRVSDADTDLHLPPIYLDVEAKNGGDNARNSLTIMDSEGLPYNLGVTAIAHATSVRRLSETLKHAAHTMNVPVNVYRQATNYEFDVSNPADQSEARDEMLRLINWPEKNWLLPQSDLPEDLVDFVKDVEPKKS